MTKENEFSIENTVSNLDKFGDEFLVSIIIVIAFATVYLVHKAYSTQKREAKEIHKSDEQ